MFVRNLVSLLTLSSVALAAPTGYQEVLSSEDGTPYNKDHYDPYDRKFDSYGEDIQPLPMVGSLHSLQLCQWQDETVVYSSRTFVGIFHINCTNLD